MPSPFPGMDPYLEDPSLWPDVHNEFITCARAELNRRLSPKYYVRIEERLYVSPEDDPGRSVLIPDLRIAERAGSFPPSGAASLANGVQIAEPESFVTLMDEEIHESRLEILDREERRVITVIELLSPSNKVAGSEGRRSYQQKKQEILNSSSHWIEIDLLRSGASTVPTMAKPFDYVAHLSRVAERPKGKVWRIFLQQRLPTILVPLKPEDADARLDLQGVLDSAYDRAGYDKMLNYRQSPVIPLSAEQETWAAEVLRGKGLR